MYFSARLPHPISPEKNVESRKCSPEIARLFKKVHCRDEKFLTPFPDLTSVCRSVVVDCQMSLEMGAKKKRRREENESLLNCYFFLKKARINRSPKRAQKGFLFSSLALPQKLILCSKARISTLSTIDDGLSFLRLNRFSPRLCNLGGEGERSPCFSLRLAGL